MQNLDGLNSIKSIMKYINMALMCILIFFIYVYQIQPVFEYSGMTVNDNIDVLYFSALLGVILFIMRFSPDHIFLPSSVFSWLIFNLVYTPSVIISYVSGVVSLNEHVFLTLVMSIGMLIIFIVPRLNIYKTVNVSISERVFKLIVILAGIFCYLVVFAYYRPDASNLLKIEDISQLYDIRNDFKESSSDAPVFARYIFAWASKIFVPCFFVYGLAKKNNIIISTALITGLLLFSSTGLKSIVLGPVLIFMFWLYLRKSHLTFSMLNFLLLLLVALALILHELGSPFLNYIIIRRVLIVPGYLTGCYFDFFMSNPFTFLGYSIFEGLVDYQYPYSPPYIIGAHYFGRSEMSANANFLATSFADFGALGCFLFALLSSFFFGILNSISISKNAIPEMTALLLLPTWTLIDTSFLTAMLTHGLGIIALILIFMPRSLFNVGRDR